MATKSARGRKQDRARVAGGQDYEVRYEAKKTELRRPSDTETNFVARRFIDGLLPIPRTDARRQAPLRDST